ncbi:hypothetical protein JFX23_08050 [Schaalia cardiffensis]|uniref:hypothetical protein n=1 Tax=Schaalia cardiffensis TaxID=181487 RepID=UPI0018E81134|nr:hypothetical protein [Schaalia cardiffensis]MBJ2329712.1 hypothetical protein [Schaalia cardiffensis]
MKAVELSSLHVEALRDALSAPRLEEFLREFEGEDALPKAIDLYKWPRSNAVKEERRSSCEEDEGALLSTTGGKSSR